MVNKKEIELSDKGTPTSAGIPSRMKNACSCFQALNRREFKNALKLLVVSEIIVEKYLPGAPKPQREAADPDVSSLWKGFITSGISAREEKSVESALFHPDHKRPL